MDAVCEVFPTGDLLPKIRTGCENFLKKFPSYDGRGVVICILDTGVDPGAHGLQVTTDGKPKIIDLVDTTGSGDVTLDKVVPVTSVENECIEGLSGKKLKIPEEWLGRTTEFRLGVKPAYDLFPDSLSSRITKEFQQKQWEPMLRNVLKDAHSLKAKYEKVTPSSVEESLQKDDAIAHEECLNSIDKKFSYAGEVYDVVSFQDKDTNVYYACLDRSSDGDLSKAKLMRSYREAQEYDRLDDISLMNYSFRFHEDGKRLEIVTTGTSHGTHVAAIAAANFPDEPEKNGVAPGAQIIGLKIGDNRLKGMETGSSLMRACNYIASSETNIVNYSFGEACHTPNYGSVCSEITNLVFKHGIIFCSSSGNHGPGLGTVGAPGGTQECVVGVSPVVYPEMMEAEYSLPPPFRGGVYTWSSRGPTADGAVGIHLAAPGAAITSVPNWTLKKGQLMNGSSMSSPNACGCFALLLSALIQEGMDYNAFSVTRAFMNSAEMMEPNKFGILDQGRGCIMIDRAWDYYNQYPKDASDHFKFNVRVNSAHRGIYVRQWDDMRHPKVFTVTVSPEAQDTMTNEKRLDLELKLTLTCDAPWVTVPKYILLNNSPRSIAVRLDPASLQLDSLNVTEIKVFDSSNVKKGPVFTIPVTAIVPVQFPDETLSFERVFKQGDIDRHFLLVPPGASGCEIRLRCSSFELSSCRLALHCLQMMPHEYYKSHELHRYLNVGDTWEEYYFPVVGGRTLEICLARWWSVCGESHLEWTVRFTGLKPVADCFTILPGEQFCKINVVSHLGKEELTPYGQISHLVIPVRPSNCEICPTHPMDINAQNQIQFAMKLSYSFNLVKPTEVGPSFPLLNDLLYESDYTSQMWKLYDTNKRLIGVGDYLSEKYSFKLEKGEYQLFLVCKNQNQAQLERLRDMIMMLWTKNVNSVPLEFFGSLPHLSSNRKASITSLAKGLTKTLYLAMPSDDKIPKHATSGSYLVGNISLHKSESWKKVITYPLKLVIGDPPKKNAKKGKGIDDDKIRSYSDIKDSVRNLKFAALQKLENKEEISKLYDELVNEYGEDDLELCYNRLLSIEHTKCKTVESINDIVMLCDTLIKGLANDELAHFCVNKAETYNTKDTSQMEKQKMHLMETLCRTGISLGLFIQKSTSDKTPEDSEDHKRFLKELDDIYTHIRKWTDPKDSKLNSFLIEFYAAKGLWGSALKLLMKTIEEKPSKENELRAIEVIRKLGWTEIASVLERQVYLKHPHDFRPW